jgi:predicted nucleic acid-binding Zn ribbon protein
MAVQPINQAVPGALVELLREAPLSPGKVSFAWRAAVGAAMERVTTVRLDGHTLVVDATSTQWAREVSRSAGVILTRVQTLLGADAVTSISIRTQNVERP